MDNIIELNALNLSSVPENVKIPTYDRSKVKTGIVHVGIGGFHRAHQAYYTDELLQSHGADDWGICGIALLETDKKIYDVLARQDGLYTLMITEQDGRKHARVIGSIVEYLFAPLNPAAVIKKMADPGVRIITLTITEGGYNFHPDSGEFMADTAGIQWDLYNPEQPKTIFGYLTQALKLRKENGTGVLTLQSCDNIQHNGAVLKKMLMAYIALAEPELSGWVQKHVSFPNSMVDRITPVTAIADIASLSENFSIADEWPVVCEPFCQWIIADDFIAGRPAWEKVGAQFVDEVDPYEKMKIRLVNGGHVSLGFTGYLNGYRFVNETISDDLYYNFVRGFLDKEASPVLDPVPGIDIEVYKTILMQRFANPHIQDQLTRIFSESSAKIPKFIIPTLLEQLENGGEIRKCVLMIASWCRYLELADTEGYADEVQDEMRSTLIANAKASLESDELAFIKMDNIFGNLVSYTRFTELYLSVIRGLRSSGIVKMIETLDKY
ncbi:mannitol dehydrogenase family protein [Pedobacter heparinus]|uniref:mannitol dehydrogenase family protein n=1 Tax=Pedobacter heparinus TaxID=984 RepID=UPI002931E20D|nr:mannitol dehydrogenase family protein [Pedobacter heparinus]